MAIFDSEKRPRGLRVPNLTAMKNGAAASKSQFSLHRTKSDPKAEKENIDFDIGTMPLPAAVPAPPPQRAPPPSKELPPPPKDQVPPPPKRLSKVPPRRELSKNATSAPAVQPVQPPEVPQPVVAPSPVVSSPQVSSPQVSSPQVSSPQAYPPQVYSPQNQPAAPPTIPIHEQHSPQPAAPQPISPAVPAVVSQSINANQSQEYFPSTRAPPVTLSPAPPGENDNEIPLEDFIPTPDGAGSPLEHASSNEQQPPLFTPLEMEPTPAPLTTSNYNCFQEHRNMPTAQNVWCPIPCQTCHKFDREIKHRCVFCAMRICESCYQGLQKCKNRSLAELMSKLGRV